MVARELILIIILTSVSDLLSPEDKDEFMTASLRYRATMHRKIDELSEQFISFAALIIWTSLEGFYLYLLVRIHEPVDKYIDKSPLCPVKLTIVIMGVAFLGLNLLTVSTFVVIHSHETFKVLKKTFKKKRSPKHNSNLRTPKLRAA